MYTVTLSENKNMPYVIEHIEVDNENDAIYEAKKFVANNGYFPYMSEERIMHVLSVENVTKEQ